MKATQQFTAKRATHTSQEHCGDHLIHDYQTGRVAKGSTATLFFLDHIVTEDDRDFSCGSNKPCALPQGRFWPGEEPCRRCIPLEGSGINS
jgi:hypothetical protein